MIWVAYGMFALTITAGVVMLAIIHSAPREEDE